MDHRYGQLCVCHWKLESVFCLLYNTLVNASICPALQLIICHCKIRVVVFSFSVVSCATQGAKMDWHQSFAFAGRSYKFEEVKEAINECNRAGRGAKVFLEG